MKKTNKNPKKKSSSPIVMPVDDILDAAACQIEKAAVDAFTSQGMLSDSARALSKTLVECVDFLREHSPVDGPAPTKLFRRAAEIDPVTAFSVLCWHRGGDSSKCTFRPDAISSFVASSDDYLVLLGCVIPDALKSVTARQIAVRKLQNGGNESPLKDWTAYLQCGSSLPPARTTGLPRLDVALGGGLRHLTLVGGDEGKGKTSLVLGIVLHRLRSDQTQDCTFFTVDQPKMRTMDQLRCLVTGCDLATLRLSKKDRSSADNRRIREGDQELVESLVPRLLFVGAQDLDPKRPFSKQTLAEHRDRLRASSNTSSGLIVVDLFQSLDRLPSRLSTPNERDEYRLKEILGFINQSATAAEPDGEPVIATVEIRKEGRTVLTSNDMSGSARLGSVPSSILLLWPTPGTPQDADLVQRTLRVEKSRYGQTGNIDLMFDHRRCLFHEIEASSKTSTKGVAKPLGKNKI